MSKPRPTRQTKATALAIGLVTGTTHASEATGVPARTIRHWVSSWRAGEVSDTELLNEVEELVAGYTAEARVEMAEAVAKAAHLLRSDIDRYLSTPRETPLKPAEMRDVAVTAGILCDKLAVMEGRPSSVNASFRFSTSQRPEPRPMLLELMEQHGTKPSADGEAQP